MTLETVYPTDGQRKMVIREACHLVRQMQNELSPPEALAMLSVSLQLVILGSAPTRAEAIAVIDHVIGEVRTAVLANLGTHSEAGHG